MQAAGKGGNGILDNEQFRMLINHIPGTVYRCTGDEWLSLEFFSDEIVNLTGYPLNYFLERPKDGYLSIVHPEDRDGLKRKMHEAVNTRQKYEFEYRIVRKDGSMRWVLERGQGVYEEAKQLRHVDGCIFDISHRKNAEAALLKSKEEITQLSNKRELSQQEQEELLQRLTLATDSAAIAIWEIDLKTNQVIWDKRMFAMYGYPGGTDISLYKVFEKAVHPEDASIMNEIIGDLLTGKKELNGAIYRIILPDGRTRFIESHAIIKKSSTGKVVSLIGTNRDITEEMLVQEKIKAQNKMLRDIAFIQSHEVRRPLANILGVIEILKASEAVSDLEIFHHLEESARELDQEIRSIVNKANDLDDEAFR
jgi:PAS domain S-box-containing protein